MTLETQFKLKSNLLYTKYLHENSYWYKILSRDPSEFTNFEHEVKVNYKLRPQDKISKALDTFDMVSTIISSLK